MSPVAESAPVADTGPVADETVETTDKVMPEPGEPGTPPIEPKEATAEAAPPTTTGEGRDEVGEPDQDPAEKKRIQDQLRQESRKRGNRMFGMMLGTLKRAKQQVDTSVESDSMKKRMELEKKLKDKLDGEKKVLQIRTEREREVRELKASIQKREEEIGAADAIYRVRHEAKYNLAGFLCTSFPLPTPASTTDAVSVPFTPRLPHSMHLTSPTTSANRPIYYLPYRLLPSQEDRIEDQIDAVKKATKRDQDEWRDVKIGKQKELRALRDELQDKLEDVGRLEREDRQRKRREAEEREEVERQDRDKRRRVRTDERPEGLAAEQRMEDVQEPDHVSPRRSGSVVARDQMAEDASVTTKEDPVVKKDGKDANKMDITGEEDLEY